MKLRVPHRSFRAQVTLVYPEKHFMERLFTPEIAAFYEKVYADKGVVIKEGNTVSALEGKDGHVRILGFPQHQPCFILVCSRWSG